MLTYGTLFWKEKQYPDHRFGNKNLNNVSEYGCADHARGATDCSPSAAYHHRRLSTTHKLC